jgi:hypothetical protein
MSAEIATYLRCLSNSLLALYLSVADPTGDKLAATATEASRLVGWSTVAVAIGVAFELFEPIDDAIKWIKRIRRRRRERAQLAELSEFSPVNAKAGSKKSHATSDHPTWVKVFGRIGIVLVILGVVGEWRYSGQLEDAHDAIHQYDIGKIEAADEKAGDADKSAKSAAGAASDAKIDAGKVRTLALNTEQSLETEHQTRVLLEESLNPRLMYFLKFSDGTTNIDDLKLLKGKSVRFRYVPDPEAARAAANLAGLFRSAGWNIEPILPLPQVAAETLAQDGITVESYIPAKGELSVANQDPSLAMSRAEAHFQSVDRTDAVVKWIRENGWEAKSGNAEQGEIPPDSILVRVGLKPYPFFEDAQYKKGIDDDNRRRHIDPNRYKNKTVVWKSLTIGSFIIFAGPSDQTKGQEKR